MMRIRRRVGKRPFALPEIVLTPLIDTALTLLVIFMITTPVVHNSIKIDLPRGESKEAVDSGREKPVIVSVDLEGAIFLNDKKVTMDSLGDALRRYLKEQGIHEQRVWVKIDRTKSVDVLSGVIGKINGVSGVKDVAIAIEKPATKTV
jgi:biopolymer transport protein ExbD